MFRKTTPTQRSKMVLDNKLCFSCLNGQHSFRKSTKPRKWLKQGCSGTHNTVVHGSEKMFPQKWLKKSVEFKETTAGNVAVVTNKAEESSGMPSVTKVDGLLQITEVNLHSSFQTEKFLVVCGSACSNSWITEKLARKLKMQGTPLKLIVHVINSRETIVTQIVELNLTPVHSGGLCPAFPVKRYVRKHLNVGTEVFEVEAIQFQYQHFPPIFLKKYSCGEVEKILGQNLFHCIRPLGYFEFKRKNTPITVRLPLG